MTDQLPTYLCPQCDGGCNVCDHTGWVRATAAEAAALDLTRVADHRRAPVLADNVEWMSHSVRRCYDRAASEAWLAASVDPILTRYVEGAR